MYGHDLRESTWMKWRSLPTGLRSNTGWTAVETEWFVSTLDVDSATFAVALLRSRQQRRRPARVIKFTDVADQTCDRTVELCQQLFANGQLGFQ